MGRWGFMGCVGLAWSAAGLGAPVASGTYAARLLDEVMRANPQVVGAAIIATPPRGTAPVVVAATGPASAQADPADVAANRAGAPAAVLSADSAFRVPGSRR